MGKDIGFLILHHFGVLSVNSKGWQKEINLIKWHENKPKLDIRDWAPDYKKMGRGITLSPDEVLAAQDVFSNIDVNMLETAYEENENTED